VPFTLPVFNLFCDVWNAGKTPASDDPDAENVPCQFYVNSRGTFDVQPCELENYTPPLWVRMRVEDIGVWIAGQIFEVASETGRYYRARFKERMHYGFSNQYLIVVVVQCNSAGVPLIRHIEGAEPCTDSPTDAIGTSDVLWFYELDPTANGTVTSGGGGDATGSAEVDLLGELDPDANGTVT